MVFALRILIPLASFSKGRWSDGDAQWSLYTEYSFFLLLSKGRWSDGDAQWSLLTEATRQLLRIRNEDDGEFWMDFDDFVNNFEVSER